MLIIFTTTIRVKNKKNKYNANIIVIMFVGKLYILISGILVELFVYDDFISQVSKGIINIIVIINLVDNENISFDDEQINIGKMT